MCWWSSLVVQWFGNHGAIGPRQLRHYYHYYKREREGGLPTISTSSRRTDVCTSACGCSNSTLLWGLPLVTRKFYQHNGRTSPCCGPPLFGHKRDLNEGGPAACRIFFLYYTIGGHTFIWQWCLSFNRQFMEIHLTLDEIFFKWKRLTLEQKEVIHFVFWMKFSLSKTEERNIPEVISL